MATTKTATSSNIKNPAISLSTYFFAFATYWGDDRPGYTKDSEYKVCVQSSPFCTGVWMAEGTAHYIGYRNTLEFQNNWIVSPERFHGEMEGDYEIRMAKIKLIAKIKNERA